LGNAVGRDAPPKCGTTFRRPPFGRSGAYARRDLGDAIGDALRFIEDVLVQLSKKE
jgi:hypothetical protein